MSAAVSIETILLPGAPALLGLHAQELPQRDDLCGAFCASLAMRVALAQPAAQPAAQPGTQPGTQPGAGAVRDGAASPGAGTGPAGASVAAVLDQDAVAQAAGTVISAEPDPSILPAGERGRRDYRLSLPTVADPALSGTTTAGLIAAVERLSAGRLVAVPFAEPWTPATLAGLFDLAAACAGPAALVANIATHHLWGSHPGQERLLAYLLDGDLAGPAPDWDVGHFVCLLARASGPGGSLYAVADTYPSLGNAGVHLQPAERLAAAIERRDKPAGGVLAILAACDASAVRAGAEALGLVERAWDNGTAAPPAAAPPAAVPPTAAPATAAAPAAAAAPRSTGVPGSLS